MRGAGHKGIGDAAALPGANASAVTNASADALPSLSTARGSRSHWGGGIGGPIIGGIAAAAAFFASEYAIGEPIMRRTAPTRPR